MFSPFGLLRALFSRTAKPQYRPLAHLGVELLDDRTMPSTFDIAVVAARLEAPTLVRFDYTATGPATTLQVGVYRSADQVFDAGDELVGGNTITTRGAGTRTGVAGLTGQLRLDPARDFVLVVADPGKSVTEVSDDNNTASFRKVALAAVTHGFTLTGNPAPQLVPFAAELKAEGYDFVLPYIWTPLSQAPTPNGTVVAGRNLAQFVRAAAPILATNPNDVVDVHLIGHSRGTAVVSQAFQSLTQNPGPRSVQLGFFKQTLLDPHVARNFGPLAAGQAEVLGASGTVATSQVGQLSFDPSRPFSRSFALATLNFQAVAMDPPAFVPAAVDQAEVYFQRLPWNQTTYTIPGIPVSAEQFIGVNFLAPPGQVTNRFARPVQYVDLGPEGVGHYEVPEWYRQNVVPTLGG